MSDHIDIFIRDTRAIADTDALQAYFYKFALATYGFDIVSYHFIADGFRRTPVLKAFRMINLPDQWQSKYIEDAYVEIDPVLEEARRRTAPFTMREVMERGDLRPEQVTFMQDLMEAGIKDGIGVPVFGRPGDIAYFGLGSTSAEFDFSEAALLKIQTLCQHMHQRYNELTPSGECRKPSPRELQVLELIAQGKSNAAMSEILGVSTNTIDTLVRRCFEKLGVSSRVEAALVGVGRGLILPHDE